MLLFAQSLPDARCSCLAELPRIRDHNEFMHFIIETQCYQRPGCHTLAFCRMAFLRKAASSTQLHALSTQYQELQLRTQYINVSMNVVIQKR